MADFSITNAVAPVGNAASAPSSPPVDNARERFDDHLKRAGQPSDSPIVKRPADRNDGQRTEKPAPDKAPGAAAPAAPSDAPADDQAAVEATDSQQPTPDAQQDSADEEHAEHPTYETVQVAAIVLEQTPVPLVDEITIASTDSPDTQELPTTVVHSATDTTAATLQQATAGKTTDVSAKVTIATITADNDAAQSPSGPLAPAPQPLPAALPPLNSAKKLTDTNKQLASQISTEDGQVSEPSEIPPVAAQQVAPASGTQPVVTIVSAAHETPSSDQESDRPGGQDEPASALATRAIASVVAPTIQTPLPVVQSQPLNLGPEAGPEAKRAEADREPIAPTDAAPKTPPAGNADGSATGRFQISLAPRNNFGFDAPAGTSEVERVRFVQRVARAFRAAEDQGGQVRLRLNPPELGALRLEITMKAGAMTARLEAETSAARSMLLDNLPALRERLAEQNIKVEKFDVDVMDRQPGGLPDTTPDGSDRGDRSPRPFLGGESQEEPVEVAAIGGRIFVDSGQLNVVI